MKEKFSNKVLKVIKSASDNQVENIIRNKCVWFGYEPKVPNLIKEKKLKNK